MYEEQKKLNKQTAEIKTQLAQYEDQLKRKRMAVCNMIRLFSPLCVCMRNKFLHFDRQRMSYKKLGIGSWYICKESLLKH